MRTQKEAFDVQLQDSRKHSLVLSEVRAGAAHVIVLKSTWTELSNVNVFIGRVRTVIFCEIGLRASTPRK
jgi:hypothetical protein